MTVVRRRLPTVQEMHQLTDQGVEQSYEAAGEMWKREARAAVVGIAERAEPFSANDVWKSGLQPPPSGNRRALGGVIRRLVAEGVLQSAGRDQSRWGHGQSITLWEHT